MQEIYQILLTVGGILLLSLAVDYLGQRTLLPRVTLLLLLGIVIGHSGLDIIPTVIVKQFDLITDITLLMVGFLLGGQLSIPMLKNSGGKILWISLGAASGSILLVFLGLMLIGTPVEIAIILSCISSATDPAATSDVAKGNNSAFSKLLLAIVTIDDAWGLIFFSLGLTVIAFLQHSNGMLTPLLAVGHDIGGAIVLGLSIGIPAAYLTGRIKEGQPMLIEALGIVFICGGLALWLNVSFLIAAMTLGATIRNLAKHHEYAFHEIQNVQLPFMIVFFVLAGASLEINTLSSLGAIGLCYVISRSAGKIIGARLGSAVSQADTNVKNWMGIALLPQAGVAIGMALVASHHFPEHGQIILSTVIASTVVFELIGPVLTRVAIIKADSSN